MADNKTNWFEKELLESWFHNVVTPFTSNLGTNLEVALFSQDPGETGGNTNPMTGEGYPGHSRVSIPRDPSDWNLSAANVITNANDIIFPQCTGSSTLIQWAGIFETNTGQLIIHGKLTTNLTVTTGVQPQFAAGNLAFEEK